MTSVTGRAAIEIGNGPPERASAETTTKTSDDDDGVGTRNVERPCRTAMAAGLPILQQPTSGASPIMGLPRPIHPLVSIEMTTVAPTASTQTRGRREAPANNSSRRE